MATESQNYRYVSTITILMFSGLIIFTPIALLSLPSGINGYSISFLALGILSLYGFLISLYSVVVTDEKMVSKHLLRRQDLAWHDINEIIPKPGGSFSLSNRDGNTRIFISSQFKGYLKLVGFIKQQRPDLFGFDQNYFSRSIIHNIFTVICGLLCVAISIFTFLRMGLFDVRVLPLMVVGLYVLGGWFFSPQSFKLEDNTLITNHLHKKVSCSVNDISLIKLVDFGNLAIIGNSYSVVIVLKNNQLVKLSGFKQGPFVVYFVLEKWHQKFIANQSNISAS